MEYRHLSHTFDPIYDGNSKVLILGSFPSVKSREQQFYYGHPQNRFWRVLSIILQCECPETIEQKRQMLLSNYIAVWDVIAECDIIGSSDSSIKNVKVNPLNQIIKVCEIRKIYLNGATAAKLYREYSQEQIKTECIQLPSTSPANAAYSIERLCEQWAAVREALV